MDDVEATEVMDPATTAKRMLDAYLDDLESGSPLHAVTRSAMGGEQPTEVAACIDVTGITLAISNGSPEAPVLAWAWFDPSNPQHRGALRAIRGAIDQALEQEKPRA